MTRKKLLVYPFMLTGFVFVWSVCSTVYAGVGTITPDVMTASLAPGQCVNEHKTVTIVSLDEKFDIIFTVDTSMSMEDCLDEIKTTIQNLITDLSALYSDVAYGVVTLEDYPGVYDSNPICEYNDQYGKPDSSPFTLKQPATTDVPLVRGIVDSMYNMGTWDSPESYGRAIFEIAKPQ